MSALERPDDADQIAEVLDAAERQTPGSGRNGGVPVVLPAACEGWRDRHAAGESIQSITDDHDWHYATVSEHVHGGCPHGAVRGGDPRGDEHNGGGHTGTTPPIAAVVDALETRAARSFGDTVFVTPGAFRRDFDIDATPREVGLAFRELANGAREGIEVEETNPDADRARWTARVEGER